MFKKQSGLALVLVIALVFVAAGQVAANQEWPDLSGQRVSVMGLWTGADQEAFQEVLDLFNELTGAEAVYNPAGDNIGVVIGTQIEGGNPPDVAILPQPGLVVEFARRGALVPVEEAVGETVDEYFAPVWRELATVDGELYGVWYKAANKSVMWYNVDTFEEVGIEEPATWDELMEAAELLEFYGITPFSLGGASSWTLTDWFENIYLRVAGPEMYDKLTNHEIPWTHETVVEAFTILKDVFGNEHWLAGGVQGSLEANHPEGIIRPFIDQPTAAIAYGADFSAGAIMNETNSELGKDALFFDFPSINDSPGAVVGAGDVVVALRDNEANKTLLQFLATPQAAEIWAAKGGFTSPNQGVDPAVYPSDVVRNSALALQSAEWFRFDLSDLQPSIFGSTAGTGMRFWLQEFVRVPDVERTTNALEEDAKKAFNN